MKRTHKATDGQFAAYQSTALLDGVARVLNEFQRLNTREARAAFADHWIGVWAKDFDNGWIVIYELLKIIEQDELYRDPRRVGPGAPGGPIETHAQQSSYSDFAAYFTDRVRQPLDRWAELERTYHYAQKYAPEIFKLPFPEAKKVRDKGGRPKKGEENPCGARVIYGATEHIRARLKRDGHTELLEKIERGEMSARAVEKQLGWRAYTIQHPPTVEGFVRSARKHLGPAEILALKESL